MYFFQGQLPSKRCTILPLFQFKIIEYIAIYRTYKIYCNRMITKASIFKSPLGMSFTTPFPYEDRMVRGQNVTDKMVLTN